METSVSNTVQPCTLNQMEERLESAVKIAGDDPIIVNLSDISSFDTASLIGLACFIAKQSSRPAGVEMVLPIDRQGRDAMRQFHLPEILCKMTGQAFASFCAIESMQYFGENDKKEMPSQNYRTAKDFADYLTAKKPAYSAFIPSHAERMLSHEFNALGYRWDSDFALNGIFLKMNFYPEAHRISRGILDNMFENVIIESDKRAALCSTNVVPQEKGHVLEIAFWDNGKMLSEDYIEGTLNDPIPYEDVVHRNNLDSQTAALLRSLKNAIFVLGGEVSFLTEKSIVTMKRRENHEDRNGYWEKMGGYRIEKEARPDTAQKLQGNLTVFKLPLKME